MKKYEKLPYAENTDGKHILNEYLPDTDKYDVIVYFHGGGLEAGSQYDAEKFCELVERGYAIISAKYRFLSETDFSGILEDAAKAVSYAYKKFKNNNRIFISGSSAGAYITTMLLMNPKYLAAEGLSLDDIDGFISDSSQVFAHFNVLKQRGYDSRLERIDETAPIYYLSESSHLRPLLLMFYSNDMKCRKEENLLFSVSVKRFFPDADLTVKEIKGSHCNPDDMNTLIDAIYEFLENC